MASHQKNSKLYNARPHQNGFSIIEAMIGTLILSFGFMNYAYISSLSVKSVHDNTLRVRAAFLATDIIERMRANYELASQDLAAYQSDFDESAADYNPKNCETNLCSPTEIRDWDIANWKEAIESELLDAKGEISHSTLPDGTRQYSVVIDYANRTLFAGDDSDTNKLVAITTVL